MVMGRAVNWMTFAILLSSTLYGFIILAANDANAYSIRAPIRIAGDWDFTSENGVSSGTGTVEDPFIIEGFEISNESGTGIEILGTSAFFVIRDCLVHNSSYGIQLNGLSNGTIDTCNLFDNTFSVFVTDSTNVSVDENEASSDLGCIGFDRSTDCAAYGNNCTITDYNGRSIAAYQSQSIRIEQNSMLGDRGLSLHIEESQEVIVKSNIVHGYGCELEESDSVSLWSNTFLLSGISVIGTSACAYDSLDIPTNNTSNGLPIYYLQGESAGEHSYGDAGQIIIANCSEIEVRDSSVSHVAGGGWYGGGVECYYSYHIVFSNMTVTWCSAGLTLFGSDNVTIRDSAMLENYLNVQATFSNNTIVTGCSMVNSYAEGYLEAMYFLWSNFTQVVDCQIRFIGELVDPYTLYRNGIGFTGIHEALVQNCTIKNTTGHGVRCTTQMFQSEGLTVRGCRISESRLDAVEIRGTRNVVIENNSFALTDRAIDAYGCSGIEIRNNSLILNDWCGVHLHNDVSWCNVTGNWFAWNEAEGIAMEGANITIAWNSFIESGVAIEGGRDDLLVHHNDFIQNREPINPYVCTRAFWDDGYPSGGNYYSDYTGLDEFSGPDQDIPGSDGIGDLPYVHDSYHLYEDRYPLMSPAVSHGSAPTALVEVQPSSGTTLTLFNLDSSGSFDAETPTSDLWFRWDYEGDGTWDTEWTQEMSVEHEFFTGGTYNITVQVLDPSGLNSTATVSVQVIDEVIPEFSSPVVIVAVIVVMMVILAFSRRPLTQKP
jgi:nitrous oxidase accessory protein NosD